MDEIASLQLFKNYHCLPFMNGSLSANCLHALNQFSENDCSLVANTCRELCEFLLFSSETIIESQFFNLCTAHHPQMMWQFFCCLVAKGLVDDGMKSLHSIFVMCLGSNQKMLSFLSTVLSDMEPFEEKSLSCSLINALFSSTAKCEHKSSGQQQVVEEEFWRALLVSLIIPFSDLLLPGFDYSRLRTWFSSRSNLWRQPKFSAQIGRAVVVAIECVERCSWESLISDNIKSLCSFLGPWIVGSLKLHSDCDFGVSRDLNQLLEVYEVKQSIPESQKWLEDIWEGHSLQIENFSTFEYHPGCVEMFFSQSLRKAKKEMMEQLLRCMVVIRPSFIHEFISGFVERLASSLDNDQISEISLVTESLPTVIELYKLSGLCDAHILQRLFDLMMITVQRMCSNNFSMSRPEQILLSCRKICHSEVQVSQFLCELEKAQCLHRSSVLKCVRFLTSISSQAVGRSLFANFLADEKEGCEGI
eukprot:TRINITY_DN9674_c0_g2_i1.p1 TRINITY_DN9674_c0_g2~~TRINITY_DN9674_c0_g2_i1.p1  ORF type:complete len:511 (-),score=85.42 TRINITY_DN9674_c0_g2_i1:541-1965(-)